MKKLFPFLLSVLWTSAFASGVCPPPNEASPCDCRTTPTGTTSVRCAGRIELNAISSLVESMSDDQILEFQMDSVDLSQLPAAARNVQSLRVSHSKIGQFQISSSATWPQLNEVSIDSVTLDRSESLQLQGARLLKYLKITSLRMPRIGAEFREGIPEGVRYLDLRKTGTTDLEVDSMSHLSNLIYLLMVDMPLKEFPRGALPVKMPRLHTFILGNTEIESLQEDFFGGMPKIEVLMLNGNKLTTLDSKIFAPLSTQLSHLLAERNPLICGCSLLWIKKALQNKQSMKVLATCYDNIEDKFKEVTGLEERYYC